MFCVTFQIFFLEFFLENLDLLTSIAVGCMLVCVTTHLRNKAKEMLFSLLLDGLMITYLLS